MAKIFISYSRKDIEFAKRLTTELSTNNLDFWVDWEGIPPTVDWWKEIEKGIEEADVFVFLISPDSSVSKVCGQEIDYAIKNSKRIIPLVVRDVQSGEAPKSLGHLNWIFFRESDDFAASIQKLLTAMHTDYDWVQAHRRLQVKALEWERNHRDTGFLLRGKDLQDAEQALATNTSKEPHPTDLQREYVFASRKATDRQRRILTGVSVAGVILMAALAVYGFIQAGLARTAQAEAEAETRRATAQRLALESKTAAQGFPQRSVLLALEAMRVSQQANEPVLPEAEEALRFAMEGLPGRQLAEIPSGVDLLEFVQGPAGPQDTWLLAGSSYGETTVWVWNWQNLMNESASYQPARIFVPGDSETEDYFPIAQVSPQGTWLLTNDTEGFSLWQIADADEQRSPVNFTALPEFINPADDTLVLEPGVEQVVLWRVNPDLLGKAMLAQVTGTYEYHEISPKGFWALIGLGKSQWLMPISGSGVGGPPVEFSGQIYFVGAPDERLVVEQGSNEVTLWEVNASAGTKVERWRTEGRYAGANDDFTTLAVQDAGQNLLLWDVATLTQAGSLPLTGPVGPGRIFFDPQGRWLVALESMPRPEIQVPLWGEFGTQGTEDWVSTTVYVFSLTDFGQPLYREELMHFLAVRAFSREEDVLVFSAGLPDEGGWGINVYPAILKLGNPAPRFYVNESTPWGTIPKLLQDGWLVDLASNEFYNLRDEDMLPDASYQDNGFDRVKTKVYDEYADPVISPDGKYLMAGPEMINLPILYETGALVVEPNPAASPEEQNIVNLLAFHPLRLGLEGGPASVSAVSPDGNWLVAGTTGGTLRMWDISRPEASRLKLPQLGASSFIALSNDGRWLATGNTLWRLSDGVPLDSFTLKKSEGMFGQESGVFSPDGRWFIHLSVNGKVLSYTSSFDGATYETSGVDVSLVDLSQPPQGSVFNEILLNPVDSSYSFVQFSPDSKWVLIGGGLTQSPALLIRLEDRLTFSLPTVTEAVFSPDARHMVLFTPDDDSGDDSGVVPEVWSLPQGVTDKPKRIADFGVQESPVISRDARWLLTFPGGRGGTDLAVETNLWDVTCKINQADCEPIMLRLNQAAFSPDSSILMSAWKANEEYLTPQEYSIAEPGASNGAISLPYSGSSTRMFDPVIGKTGSLILLRKDESCDMQGRLTSTAVLSASWNKNPWLANLTTFDGYAFVELLMGGGGGSGDPGYHEDFRVDALVREGESYRTVVLRGHESSITVAQASPDERYALTFSGGADKNCVQHENLLRLWDMEKMRADPLTKAVILPLKTSPEFTILHLAFSPDSQWVYVIDQEYSLYTFPVSIDVLQEKACRLLGRNFIINEWERFFPGQEYRQTCENLPVHPSVNQLVESP